MTKKCVRTIVAAVVLCGIAHAEPRRLGDPIPPELGMVNVKLPPFNAKGDGISDDTKALQAAVALAGHQFARRHIFFPAGTYLISEPLVWSSASYFEMLGESEAGATIRLAPRSPAF